jgi:hypothetical protein
MEVPLMLPALAGQGFFQLYFSLALSSVLVKYSQSHNGKAQNICLMKRAFQL